MSHTTALDPEELSEEIKRYPFAKIIPPTVLELKTPDEIRREADLDILDEKGNFIEKKYSASFRQHLLDKANKGEAVTLETSGKVEIDRGILRELEHHIRQCWTVRQIVFFYPFLHGGYFTSANGGWKRTIYGHVTQTHEEDTALTRLFDQLRDTCHNYIGAASAVEMYGAQLRGGYCFADAGDGKSLFDQTLNELRGEIPEGLRERIEKETKPLEADLGDVQSRRNGLQTKVNDLIEELAKVKKERDAARNERDAAREVLLKMQGIDLCAVG